MRQRRSLGDEAGHAGRGQQGDGRRDKVCWNPAAGMCVTHAPKTQHQTSVDVVACSNCGASVARDSKFCPECGQALKTNVTCSKCGKESPVGTKFCPECGTKLE